MRILPSFPYHPDPLSTGAVIPSANACVCCHEPRGYVYAGPVYAEEEYGEQLCPWCIADGSASRELGVYFTDDLGVGGGGEWDQVPDDVVEAVTLRTPGFNGWQQERWWTHCADAAAFLGRFGRAELEAVGQEAIEAIRLDAAMPEADWQAFFQFLEKDGSPTAYLFRCRHCGAFGGYQDSH
ncbi:CbrC family protein [Roseomonas mucosa]|uniref:CbrC family protein n=1 Tax=Roseomonas mucosa TaxID=207340 RepID=UPI0028CD8294|nr:CbrC family protein [Roseomonas mucosa]MDT8350969.1 CbrC family protein [Roseomonas mucosa]